MAIAQNPFIGRTRGKCAGIVFSTVYGQNVIRSAANSYRDANTDQQQGNRAISNVCVKIASGLKTVARSWFETQPVGMAAYSRLIQQLQTNVDRTALPYALKKPAFVLGNGSVEMETAKVSYTPATGVLEVSWSDSNFPAGYDSEEQMYGTVFNRLTGQVLVLEAEIAGIGEASGLIQLPVGTPAANLSFVLGPRKFKSGADLSKNVKRAVPID